MYHMNVRPVFPGPLYWRVLTICVLVWPSSLWTENTVEKINMPHIRLTMLFMIGVALPSFTAPWFLFMNVAYVRKVPSPAPVSRISHSVCLIWIQNLSFPSLASQLLLLVLCIRGSWLVRLWIRESHKCTITTTSLRVIHVVGRSIIIIKMYLYPKHSGRWRPARAWRTSCLLQT